MTDILRKKRGPARKVTPEREFDLKVAQQLPHPDDWCGWRTAEQLVPYFGERVCELYNESREFDSCGLAWHCFRSQIDVFGLNADLSSAVVDLPDAPELKATDAEIESAIRGLASGDVAMDDVPTHVLVEAFPDIVDQMIDWASSALPPSMVHPDRVVLGLSLTPVPEKGRTPDPVKYASPKQAGEMVASVIHRYLNTNLLIKQLKRHFETLHAERLSQQQAETLSRDLQRLYWHEAMQAVAPEVAKKYPANHGEPRLVDLFIADVSSGGLPYEYRVVDALIWLVVYLYARQLAGSSWDTSHLRICLHRKCSAPAFLWQSNTLKGSKTPDRYCRRHNDADKEADRKARQRAAKRST